MRERERQHDEPRLFDLPLEPDGAVADEPQTPEPAPPDEASAAPEPVGEPAVAESLAAPEDEAAAEPLAEVAELPLFAPQSASSAPPPADAGESPLGPRPVPDPEPHDAGSAAPPLAEAPRGPQPAPFQPRLLAALADLGVFGLVFVVGLLGALMIGVAPVLAKMPAFGLFLLSFSFLYAVVSLAFWGQTPGMAAAGVVARGGGDRPLTFGQTGLRWVAGVLTAALLGLPVLLALSGRSLADRLSGSSTFLTRAR